MFPFATPIPILLFPCLSSLPLLKASVIWALGRAPCQQDRLRRGDPTQERAGCKAGAGTQLLGRARIERRSLEMTEVESIAASSGDSDLCSVSLMSAYCKVN